MSGGANSGSPGIRIFSGSHVGATFGDGVSPSLFLRKRSRNNFIEPSSGWFGSLSAGLVPHSNECYALFNKSYVCRRRASPVLARSEQFRKIPRHPEKPMRLRGALSGLPVGNPILRVAERGTSIGALKQDRKAEGRHSNLYVMPGGDGSPPVLYCFCSCRPVDSRWERGRANQKWPG
jgi:hypothetical protein